MPDIESCWLNLADFYDVSIPGKSLMEKGKARL